MYRLFYVSTAAPGIDDAEACRISNAAASRNSQLEITGALAFNGVNFGQILEGEKQIVDSLMNEIRSDGRHNGIIVVDQKPVRERAYEGWSMKRVEGLSFEEFLSCMTS